MYSKSATALKNLLAASLTLLRHWKLMGVQCGTEYNDKRSDGLDACRSEEHVFKRSHRLLMFSVPHWRPVCFKRRTTHTDHAVWSIRRCGSRTSGGSVRRLKQTGVKCGTDYIDKR